MQIIPTERTSEPVSEIIEAFVAHSVIASTAAYKISHFPILANSTPTTVLQLNGLNKSLEKIYTRDVVMKNIVFTGKG